MPKRKKYFVRKVIVLQRYLVIGLFFLFVAAPGFSVFFTLKESTDVLSSLLFGTSFEFYVYFNFAGFTFITWSLMRVFGIRVPRNFKEPFASHSVIDYWRRWHISLGIILKELFFKPLKSINGIWFGVLGTFIASAVWHGMTVNFLIWGIFHSFCWYASRIMFLKHSYIFLQVALLVFAITIGRVIFSENDINVLIMKLFNIFTFSGIEEGIITIKELLSSFGKVSLLQLSLGLTLVVLEVYNGIKQRKSYSFLLKPWTSIFLVAMLFLLVSGADSQGPIYGAR